MKIIGLTGGIGSGKSTIANILKKKYHAYLIIADEIGHLALQPGEKTYQQIIDYFGDTIRKEGNEIDRAMLSQIIFHEDEKRLWLNSIIHPFVQEKITALLHKLKEDKQIALILIETAILFEAGYQDICDEIWCVVAEERIRRNRLKESRSYSEMKIDAIMANQLTEEEFKKNCSNIIINNGNLEEIERQIQFLLE